MCDSTVGKFVKGKEYIAIGFKGEGAAIKREAAKAAGYDRASELNKAKILYGYHFVDGLPQTDAKGRKRASCEYYLMVHDAWSNLKLEELNILKSEDYEPGVSILSLDTDSGARLREAAISGIKITDSARTENTDARRMRNQKKAQAEKKKRALSTSDTEDDSSVEDTKERKKRHT